MIVTCCNPYDDNNGSTIYIKKCCLCPIWIFCRLHKSAITLKKLILTIGAVVVVLTAPYLSDSGGSGIITPLLFIKLTNQTNS